MDPRLTRYLREIGRKGGLARVKAQTPAERRKSAQKAARARWEARRKLERAFWAKIGAKRQKGRKRRAT